MATPQDVTTNSHFDTAVVAWVHEDDPTRVISQAQKVQALKDGGASASSVRRYSLPAVLEGQQNANVLTVPEGLALVPRRMSPLMSDAIVEVLYAAGLSQEDILAVDNNALWRALVDAAQAHKQVASASDQTKRSSICPLCGNNALVASREQRPGYVSHFSTCQSCGAEIVDPEQSRKNKEAARAGMTQAVYQRRFFGDGDWMDLTKEEFEAFQRVARAEDMRFRILYTNPVFDLSKSQIAAAQATFETLASDELGLDVNSTEAKEIVLQVLEAAVGASPIEHARESDPAPAGTPTNDEVSSLIARYFPDDPAAARATLFELGGLLARHRATNSSNAGSAAAALRAQQAQSARLANIADTLTVLNAAKGLGDSPTPAPAQAPSDDSSVGQTTRKAFVCASCEGVYADEPVSRCDCMPDVEHYVEGTITYPSISPIDRGQSDIV